MDWRFKCAAFYALSHAPRGLYSLLQRRVTGRYFFNVTDTEFAAYDYHVRNFRKIARPANALEFGAGSHLLTALLLSAAGATEVLTYDIDRKVTIEQVNHVIRQLRSRAVPGEWRELQDLNDLLRFYRIRYCAPGDARNTGLRASSVDFFCSTSTLEHIPVTEIDRIFNECARIATGRARWSHIIDYHDHYASSDPSITRFNFFRYSAKQWQRFNPSSHSQNRLRHSDFLELFKRHGLEPIEEHVTFTHESLPFVPHAEFSRYSRDDLQALNGLFCLKASNHSQE